jgi:hypothetical protein
MKELEDILKTDEFKSLHWTKRILIRFKAAFIQMINYGL